MYFRAEERKRKGGKLEIPKPGIESPFSQMARSSVTQKAWRLDHVGCGSAPPLGTPGSLLRACRVSQSSTAHQGSFIILLSLEPTSNLLNAGFWLKSCVPPRAFLTKRFKTCSPWSCSFVSSRPWSSLPSAFLSSSSFSWGRSAKDHTRSSTTLECPCRVLGATRSPCPQPRSRGQPGWRAVRSWPGHRRALDMSDLALWEGCRCGAVTLCVWTDQPRSHFFWASVTDGGS